MWYGTDVGNPCIPGTESVAVRAVDLEREILDFKIMWVSLCICEHNRRRNRCKDYRHKGTNSNNFHLNKECLRMLSLLLLEIKF